AACLVGLHDLAHRREDARGNALDEQSLTEFVKIGEGLAAQIARRPCQHVPESHPAEPVPHRRLDDPQHLADPRLPASDPVVCVCCRGEPGDQRAGEIEERPDLRAGRACVDLRDWICCRRLRAHRYQAYVAAYRPRPVTSGISSAVRMPGGPATTSGMAFTIRPAAARMAAQLWSPLRLVGQMSMA